MASKKFIIILVICMVIISILTSYLTFLFLKGAGGISGMAGAGTEGSISLNGLDTGTTNVIIVDSSWTTIAPYEYQVIGDSVTFTSVATGGSYCTLNSTVGGSVLPFLIRNVGTVTAYVKLYVTQEMFDQTTTSNPSDPSTVQFWVSQAAPLVGGSSNWDKVDNCDRDPITLATAPNSCFLPANNLFPGDSGAGTAKCTVTPASCLDFRSVIGIGAAAIIITNTATPLKGLQYLQPANEAFLHVKVKISAKEGTGTKTNTIHITGYQAV